MLFLFSLADMATILLSTTLLTLAGSVLDANYGLVSHYFGINFFDVWDF